MIQDGEVTVNLEEALVTLTLDRWKSAA
jgi:hypothetical protein